MQIKVLVLLFILTPLSNSALAFDCKPLEPRGGVSSDESFQGKLRGQIDGVFAKLAGASADVEGTYRQIKTDVLNKYPDASTTYIWERIIYLQCGLLSESKADDKIKNDQLQLLITKYLSGPPKDGSQLGQITLVHAKDKGDPAIVREYFDRNSGSFDIVISNPSDFLNQLIKVGVSTSKFDGATDCGDGGVPGGATPLVPLADYVIDFDPDPSAKNSFAEKLETAEYIVDAEPPIHFDPMSSARVRVSLNNKRPVDCGFWKDPKERADDKWRHIPPWTAYVRAIFVFGGGQVLRTSEYEYSREDALIVAFNFGLNHPKFGAGNTDYLVAALEHPSSQLRWTAYKQICSESKNGLSDSARIRLAKFALSKIRQDHSSDHPAGVEDSLLRGSFERCLERSSWKKS
jgi:hypothetical protein